MCHQPSGFGRWRIFDLGCASVKYSVTFQNLQAGDKIFDLNLWTINIILSFICRQMTNICLEISRQIFPYYTGKNNIVYFLWFSIKYLCNKPSGFGRWGIFDLGCASVKYSVTFQNLQAGDKIFHLNLWTINIISRCISRYITRYNVYQDIKISIYIYISRYQDI